MQIGDVRVLQRFDEGFPCQPSISPVDQLALVLVLVSIHEGLEQGGTSFLRSRVSIAWPMACAISTRDSGLIISMALVDQAVIGQLVHRVIAPMVQGNVHWKPEPTTAGPESMRTMRADAIRCITHSEIRLVAVQTVGSKTKPFVPQGQRGRPHCCQARFL